MVDKTATMQGLYRVAFGSLLIIIAFGIIPLVGSSIDDAASIAEDAYATATLNITGNVTCGQLVNITNRSGIVVYFEYNVTDEPSCAAKNGAYDDVVLARWQNTSTIAATNLTTAINANVSTSTSYTATSSNGLITLTADAVGTAGNVAISESLANGAWSSATLLGGSDGSDWSSTHNANITTGIDFWESVGNLFKIGGILIVIFGILDVRKGLVT